VADFTYDESDRHYYDEDGNQVSRDDLRQWILLAIAYAAGNIKRHSERLVAGKITREEWYEVVLDEIANEHTAFAAVAAGGFDQMGPGDWNRLAVILADQDDYLQNFAADIEAGLVSEAQLLARAALYAEAGFSTFENLLRQVEIDSGEPTEEVRRDVGDASECETCVWAASQGWQPIGTLPDIGDSECAVNCRCFFEYR